MGRFIDLTGQTYSRLTVLQYAGVRNGRTSWLCQCECGATTIVSGNDLRRGKTKSCGCYANYMRAKRAKKAGQARGAQMKKHGCTGERLYGVWKAMRSRCFNQNDKYFDDYGGRGITVCEEWNDYSAFRSWAYANGYEENAPFGECTLDRIDNSKGYSPGNCRWVGFKTQANNRRERRCRKTCV